MDRMYQKANFLIDVRKKFLIIRVFLRGTGLPWNPALCHQRAHAEPGKGKRQRKESQALVPENHT